MHRVLRSAGETVSASETGNLCLANDTSTWPRTRAFQTSVWFCGLIILAGGLALVAASLNAPHSSFSDPNSALQLESSPGLFKAAAKHILEQTIDKQTCILHVSYGEKYMSNVDNFTVPIKQEYAQLHGYTLKLFQRPSIEDLFTQDFASCGISNASLRSKHRNDHVLLKFCGIRAAFADGCAVVMWTDSDAAFSNSGITVDSWLAQNRDADIIWSVAGPHEFCEIPVSKGCVSAQHFTKCVNSGLFIVRNTPWSDKYVSRILERAVQMVPAEHWEETWKHFWKSGLPKSEWKVPLACDLHPYNPPEWSQCYPQEPGRLAYGDQCVIACEAMSDTGDIDHFHCTSSQSFQYVLKNRDSLIPPGAYLVNCAGHDEDIASCFHDISEARETATTFK
jgi:hypothetical protein